MPYPGPDVFPSVNIFPGVEGGIQWDKPDERYYHTGLDHGVLYTEDGAVPWNGLTGSTENGAGDKSVLYRDGHIYHADVEPGDYEGSVTAFFWPDEFSKCLGMPEIAPGLRADNQKPRKFGLSYRTLVGSGTTGDMFGHEIHLIYNAMASIGQRTRKTMTDKPEINEFSFDLTATPVSVKGIRPTAHFIIDTRNLSPTTVSFLESLLYTRNELPDIALLYDVLKFGDSITFVDLGNGNYRVSGSSNNVINQSDGSVLIRNVTGVDNGDGTYTLSDTP